MFQMTPLISDILIKIYLNKGLQVASRTNSILIALNQRGDGTRDLVWPCSPTSAFGRCHRCHLPVASNLGTARWTGKSDFWALKMRKNIKGSLVFCNFKMKPHPIQVGAFFLLRAIWEILTRIGGAEETKSQDLGNIKVGQYASEETCFKVFLCSYIRKRHSREVKYA